jgi:hypothetical protein
MPVCTICDSTGWVCEDHPYLPWSGASERRDACNCGGGVRRVRDAIRAGIVNIHRDYRKEALSAGFYESALKFEGTQKVERFPRIQILTIAELLAGKQLQYPRHRIETFKEAQRLSKTKREQKDLFSDEPF